MSIFDAMVAGDDEDERNHLKDLMTTFYRYRMADRVLGAGLDYAGGKGEEERLRNQDLVLDIAEKKRALGLPYDDDQYEEATNQRIPFRTKGTVAAFGKKLGDLIPEPGFLKPHNSLSSVLPYAISGEGGKLESISGFKNLAAKLGLTLSNGAKHVNPFNSRLFRK